MCIGILLTTMGSGLIVGGSRKSKHIVNYYILQKSFFLISFYLLCRPYQSRHGSSYKHKAYLHKKCLLAIKLLPISDIIMY